MTNSCNEQLKAHLCQNARLESMMVMGKVNQERLAENTWGNRFVAALRGETLTRNPYVRIQPIPKQNKSKAEKEQK